MLRILLAFMIASAVALPGRAQEEKAKVDKEIENLIVGRPANLRANSFKNKSEAALAIAKRIPEFRGNQTLHQAGLLMRSYDLEEAALRESKGQRSSNMDLLDQYADLMSRDDVCTGGLKNLIARPLRKLYSPKDLDKHAAKIRKGLHLAIGRKQDIMPDLLLLYGVLPSVTDRDALAFVRSLPSEERTNANMAYYVSRICVLARHGDEDAEQRVLEELTNLKEAGGTDDIEFALAYANTPRIRKIVAEGLHSDEAIPRIGGGTILRRTICANTLIRMMQDDPTFPIKMVRGDDYLDAQLDSIEKWCTEHWKVSFPSTPRKDVRSEPHFFEVPEKTDSQRGSK